MIRRNPNAPPATMARGVRGGGAARPGALMAVVLALGVMASAAMAQDGAHVPSFRAVTGHEFGERITLHRQMVSYLEAVADASPRVSLVDQGRSWEGRRLPLAVVTSAANHARLDEVRAVAARLGDPRRTSPAEARELSAEQPAVVWMGGSIHGNELSGTEGLLKVLERLATADDPATREVLDRVVLLLDPMLNPDGRDAFAHWNARTRGRAPNPRRDDWGNDATAWEGVGYRTGHYYFDTNRDWFAHTQRETRARLETFRTWRPQVVVDAHEMSPDVEFFFDPPADPYAPTFPSFAREWFLRFGSAHAAAFDSAGFPYMTGERYNYFFPGYTTSYGSYQGAVGMLYEQGTSAGLAIHRPDESVRTLAEALEHQYVAAWAALRTAAGSREELLRDYYEAHRADLEAGADGLRRYLIPAAGGDPGLVAELAQLLLRGGVEVGRLTEAVRVGGLRDRSGRQVGERELPAGSYVVELAQPRSRLARVLLQPDVPLPESFLAEARARIERDQNPRFYDITAWSLPLLFDLETYASSEDRELPVEGLPGQTGGEPGPPDVEATLPGSAPGYAYLLDGRRAHALSVLNALLVRGFRGSVLLRPTRIAGGDVPRGTVVVPVGGQPENLHQALLELADRFGVDVRGLDTGLGESGRPALGTGDALPARRSRIGLIADDPVHPYSFGWAWYTLVEQHELPVTVLRASSLSRRPLERLDAVVLPHALAADRLAGVLGEEGRRRLADWVRAGGTLVAIGSSVDFAREELELLDLRSWYDAEEGEEAEEAYRFEVPGAVLRTQVDTLAWLTAGLSDPELPALVVSSRIYLPPDGPPDASKRAVVRYAAEPPLRLSGHLWPESEARLPGAVLVYEQRVGSGRVIAFAEDPNFRAIWRGANRLFLNAVLLGPTAP